MMSTGIPELQSDEDMNYLREAFLPDLTEEEASSHFRDLIYSSLATRTTQINNAVHVALREFHLSVFFLSVFFPSLLCAFHRLTLMK